MYGVDDFVRAADVELQQYDAHASRFEALSKSNAEKQGSLRQRLADAQAQLADASLPGGPSAVSVQQLADQLGAPALLWGFNEVQERGKKVAERLGQLATTPQFTEREIRFVVRIDKGTSNAVELLSVLSLGVCDADACHPNRQVVKLPLTM